MSIDLSTCEKGDVLISSHGTTLEYISRTPFKQYAYLDHVVRYVKYKNGEKFAKGSYGTRTNDGFVFANNRQPETDDDIVEVIKN